MSEDIRWKQRFDNFKRALRQLDAAATLAGTRPLSDLEKQGLIQGFECTHELAWNVLKDYLEHEGIVGIVGSRGSIREAFRRGLINDGEAWMAMIEKRNLSSHTYDLDTANQLCAQIIGEFHPRFADLKALLETM
jgi:nucleotidyltransferase substrate binding protein (TIGR01987 family)